MRIATWNVNSVSARLERLLAVARAAPARRRLPPGAEGRSDEASRSTRSGGGLRRAPSRAADLQRRRDPLARGAEGRRDAASATAATRPQARLVAATVGGLRVASAYIPNGKEVGSDKWPYKLEWLARLAAWADRETSAAAARPLRRLQHRPRGARRREPRGVGRDSVLCHADVRAAWAALLATGLVDVLPPPPPGGRALLLVGLPDARLSRRTTASGSTTSFSPRPSRPRCTGAFIDRDERKGKLPSDHAPVFAELA